MSEKNISYQPTDGLSYDPNEEKYWEKAALQKEITRVFEVCHGCRMCFKYCDSFPDLFKLLDNKHDGDVRKVTEEETQGIMDSCFQCKLCEVQCPYTPRDGHEFQLDFPKLVHRHQAQKYKDKSPKLRDKMLANPNKAASLARSSFGLANVLNRNKTHRAFMEKFLGIHHEKNLPDFASETFSKWADKEGHVNNSESDVHLFPTCFVENNQPEIGMDAIVVLNENGLKVSCSKGFECCGMPAWEQGDLKSLREMAKKNIDKLYPIAQEGKPVLVINPTCSMMIKDEYPRLLSEEYKEKAKTVSDSIADSCSILWDRRNEPGLKELKNIPEATIAYHAPCHQRAQSRGFRGRDVIRKLSGQKIKMVMECCGHDGTYGMKVETFEDSKRIGQKAFKAMQEAETEIWITDCPLAAMQFEQHAGVKAMHPLSFLAKCYKDG